MDSLTHVTLGVCVGEILLSKKLGKKALLWGALAQNLPDIDTLAATFVPADQDLLIHRGITHSLIFALIVGLALAFAAKKIHFKTYMSFAGLAFFFCFQLCLHDLLDTCTSYGTGLLEPFSHHRFSINLIYVADPLFTISLLVAALMLIFKPIANKHRVKWAVAGLVIAQAYLCFASFNKAYIDSKSEKSFGAGNMHPSTYITTPAPFNALLWYIVAKTDSGYYTGYASIFDNRQLPVQLQYHPKNQQLMNQAADQTVAKNLRTFGGEYYTLSKTNGNIYLNVLRFEQIHGWFNGSAPFAFSYPLSGNVNDSMLLQKGRLAGWNATTIQQYLARIMGRQNPQL
jgi:inner membrane protein